MEHYILSLEQVAALNEYVEEKLEQDGCDHSQKHILKWLEENIPADQREAVLAEIEGMGGYCDCEVLTNCYEEYDEELYGPFDDEDDEDDED